MDLSRFLPKFGSHKHDDVEYTEEELDQQDAEAKAARIQFHRDHVRNGPSNMSRQTNGQAARQIRREHRAKLRKQNIRNRRDFMRAQQNLSRLRGQLVTLGVVPQASGAFLVNQPPASQRNALKGLFDGYGPLVEQTLEIAELDFDNHEHRNHVIDAALHHYGIVTGTIEPVSA